MAERKLTFNERLSRISEVEEGKRSLRGSTSSKPEIVILSQAESALPGPRPSSSDLISNSRVDRTHAIVEESQTPRPARPETNSIPSELNEEDLKILGRLICRAAGTVTVKLLAEFFPGIESKTTIGMISHLIEIQCLHGSRQGCFKFVDPAEDIETSQLEQERKVLERVKSYIIERLRAKSSTGVPHPRQQMRSSKEMSDSGERDEIRAAESHSSVSNHRFPDEEMEIALGTASVRTDASSIVERSWKPETTKRDHLEPAASLAGDGNRFSMSEVFSNAVSQADSTMTIFIDTINENLPDSAGTERKASPPKLGEPQKKSKSIAFRQETNAPEVSENAKPPVVMVSTSGEEFQGVSSTQTAQTIPSDHSTDSSHRNRIRETGKETSNPCRMLEVVCESMGFRPPAYSITFMPKNRIFFCLLFVAGSSFPSYPTLAVDEKVAKEAAARKALQGFGITFEMVVTRNFTNAKFPMKRIQRNFSGAHAPEP